MKAVVVYKTRYGSTKTYAEWIAEELGCEMRDAKSVKAAELKEFDTVIYGGGLYAEMINGVTLLTKNMDILSGKKLLVYTTGLTPLDCRDYYDKMVMEKNFPPEIRDKFKVFNFLGKMIISELSLPHRAALKTLKKIMSGKEKLLIELCDADGDFTDRSAIADIVACASAQ